MPDCRCQNYKLATTCPALELLLFCEGEVVESQHKKEKVQILLKSLKNKNLKILTKINRNC